MKEGKKALLIIDMQNDFVLPESSNSISGANHTIPRIHGLLMAFRERKLPVFHIVREYRTDGSDIENFRYDDFVNGNKYAVPGTSGCEIVSQLTPLAGEYRIVKPRFSGFMNTELNFILNRLDVSEVVVCGIQYPNCIRATAFDAVAYGYNTTVITDATSAITREIAEANILDLTNVGVACIPANLLKFSE